MPREWSLMRVAVATSVVGDFRTVFAAFGSTLLVKLNPPIPRVALLRFDGTETGDEVHLELDFLLFRQYWVSRITEVKSDDREISFVDEGVQLPFFLDSWRHRHRIASYQGGTAIIDEIEFRASNFVLGLFLWPALYLQFIYRRPVYRRFFRKARYVQAVR